MIFTISAEYFSGRIQCTREDKQECLYTVRQLLELFEKVSGSDEADDTLLLS